MIADVTGFFFSSDAIIAVVRFLDVHYIALLTPAVSVIHHLLEEFFVPAFELNLCPHMPPDFVMPVLVSKVQGLGPLPALQISLAIRLFVVLSLRLRADWVHNLFEVDQTGRRDKGWRSEFGEAKYYALRVLTSVSTIHYAFSRRWPG